MKNGATCQENGIGHFRCHCPYGWSGDLCDVDVNEVIYNYKQYCSSFRIVVTPVINILLHVCISALSVRLVIMVQLATTRMDHLVANVPGATKGQFVMWKWSRVMTQHRVKVSF